jgi:hypothetical protein
MISQGHFMILKESSAIKLGLQKFIFMPLFILLCLRVWKSRKFWNLYIPNKLLKEATPYKIMSWETIS